MLGRRISVIPVSVLMKEKPSLPVSTTSITLATTAPALPTRKVPGSISRRRRGPPSVAKRRSSSTIGPAAWSRSVEDSSLIRPIL